MKVLNAASMVTVAVLLFLAATPSYGAGLVPCGGHDEPPCTKCHFAVLVNNVTRFGVKNLALPFAALMILFAGFWYAFSGGDEKRISAAKNTLKNAVIGLFVVLISWFLVDTAIKALVGSETPRNRFFGVNGPWNDPFQGDNACDATLRKIESEPIGTARPPEPAIRSLTLTIARIFASIILALSIILILIAALRFTTAREDEDTIRSARNMLIFALVGVGVAALAFVIPQLVISLLGRVG